MTSCAVAVVGHVDHGKTSLVRALTGQDTDRLAEEKARGLSITLGFAHRRYESGTIDFIDSPGHEDFIRAMVCGATGAQAAIVVISAIEGIQHQTREHLEILNHLNVRRGVIALSKADLISEQERAALREEIIQNLRQSPFSREPIVLCSVETGEGLDALNNELEGLLHRAPSPPPLPGAFLPIDRVFTLKGFGTVATGTLLGAPLRLDDAATLLPDGHPTAVRRLQSRGSDVEQAGPGMRTAVNLRGVPRDALKRGDVVCAPGVFSASSEVDAWVEIDPARDALRHGEAVRVLIGTAATVATVFLISERSSQTGTGYVRLRFHEPVASHVRQRGILRRLSPAETLGGVRILDPTPPRKRYRDQSRLRVLKAVRRSETIEIAAALTDAGKGVAVLAEILQLTGIPRDSAADLAQLGLVQIDRTRVISQHALSDAKAACLDTVGTIMSREQARAGVSMSDLVQTLEHRYADPLLNHAVRMLLDDQQLVGDNTQLALPGLDPVSSLPTDAREKFDTIERALRVGALAPPSLTELQGDKNQNADLIDLLVTTGRAVRLRNIALKQTLIFHTDRLEEAYEKLFDAFPPPSEFTTSQASAVLDTSRKFSIPVLEYFDKIGQTRRTGNVRKIMPRAD